MSRFTEGLEPETVVRNAGELGALLRSQRERIIGDVSITDVGEAVAFTMAALALLCEMIDAKTTHGKDDAPAP